MAVVPRWWAVEFFFSQKAQSVSGHQPPSVFIRSTQDWLWKELGVTKSSGSVFQIELLGLVTNRIFLFVFHIHLSTYSSVPLQPSRTRHNLNSGNYLHFCRAKNDPQQHKSGYGRLVLQCGAVDAGCCLDDQCDQSKLWHFSTRIIALTKKAFIGS